MSLMMKHLLSPPELERLAWVCGPRKGKPSTGSTGSRSLNRFSAPTGMPAEASIASCPQGRPRRLLSRPLRHNEMWVNSLSVTIKPSLLAELGEVNLQTFISGGLPHLVLSPDPQAMRASRKRGLADSLIRAAYGNRNGVTRNSRTL